MREINCPHCGQSTQANKRFCTRCGQPLTAPNVPVAAPTKPRATALLDGLLLFEGLPARAILHDRFLVTGEAGPREPALLRYSVEDLEGVRVCGNCSTLAPLSGQYCEHCGSDVQSQPPYYATYLLKESPNAERLAAETELAQQGTPGDGLILPLKAFQQTFGGVPHYYVVQYRPGETLDSASQPVEAVRVLGWGAQLARGMQTLHGRQIALSTLTRSNVMWEGERAWLADFGNAVRAADPAQMQANVTQLVQLLQTLLTTHGTQMPPSVQPLFGGWLNGRPPVNAGALADALDAAVQTLRRPANVTLRTGKRTDVGVVRSLNEDSMLALELTLSNQSQSVPAGLFVVADGMGGHEGGEIASGMTVRMLQHKALTELFAAAGAQPESAAWLRATIDSANRTIYDDAKRRRTDMGTTVVAVLLIGQRATIAHAGDSRAYLITPQAITQVTTDHSLVERLVATGQITRAEARDHPQGNIVYKTLGDKPKLEVDINEHMLQPGETLLLCSDGLSGMLTDEAIHSIVMRTADLQTACDELIRAANANGGEDNVTAILLRLDDAR